MKRVDPWLAGTLLLALVVRFVNLGSQSMWYDEAVTRADVAGGLGSLWGRVRRVEGTPPLYFYVTALWTHLFGQSDFAYRTVSALAGVATVVVVYFLVRELGCSRGAARIAALFVAVNPFLVWYSQEARAYALFAFLGALSMLACVRAVNRPTTGWLLAFGFAAAALLATHYFAVFLLGPELVFLAIRLWRRWGQLAIAVAPLAVVALALSPVLVTQHSLDYQNWIADFPLHFRLGETTRHFIVGPSSPYPGLFRFGEGAVVVALILLAVRASRADRIAAALMFGSGALVIAIPALAGAVGSDYYLDRNVILAVVPLCAGCAIAFATCRPGLIGVAVIVVMSLIAVVAVARDPNLQRADARGVAGAVDGPGSRVLVMNNNRLFGQTLPRYLAHTRELGAEDIVSTSELDLVSLDSIPGRCDWWFGRACTLIFLDSKLPDALAGRFTRAGETRVGPFHVTRFTAPNPTSVRAGDLVAPDQVPGAYLLQIGG